MTKSNAKLDFQWHTRITNLKRKKFWFRSSRRDEKDWWAVKNVGVQTRTKSKWQSIILALGRIERHRFWQLSWAVCYGQHARTMRESCIADMGTWCARVFISLEDQFHKHISRSLVLDVHHKSCRTLITRLRFEKSILSRSKISGTKRKILSQSFLRIYARMWRFQTLTNIEGKSAYICELRETTEMCTKWRR